MPPVVVDPDRVVPFADFEAFHAWLETHHARWDFLWLRFFKKGSGIPSVTYEEAVRAALCWGWIDGIKKTFDAQSYVLRFTPRRPRSAWSAVNTRHVAALIESGHMRAPGLALVEAAKADGRWDAAYAPGSETEMPADFLAALDDNPAARATFETLDRANLFAMMYRITTVKRAETRQRKIAEFTAMLARGEALHPIKAGRAKKG